MFFLTSQIRLIAVTVVLTILLLLSPPLDRPAESSRAQNPNPPRDRGLKLQDFVKNRYIVRFKKYRHGREHKLAMEEQLGAKKGWKWIERNNAASAYPTDFGLLELQDDRGLIEEIGKLGFVKDVSAEARYSRGLLFDNGENAGDAGNYFEAEGVEDQGNIGGFGEKKRPGKIFTSMSYEGAGNGSHSWSRQLLFQRSQITSMFGAEKLWAKGFRGSKIKMAIFDTGIRADHPHFRNIKERTNWTNEDTLNDNLGHGTFVAGVIASQDMQCLGFSPDSEIYAFRVFTDAQVSYTSWFLDAFNYAIATGINVLNLSIGGPDYLDRPFVEKVWEITANKIIMVSAIGNDGPLYGTLNNPADQSDVIGVGGIDYNDHIASFSSRGMSTWEIPHGYGRVKPDIVAYGRDIMGSKISTGCKSLSGTSVASPVVAGVVCLLASVIPEDIRWDILNPASMKQALVEGAAKLGGPNMFEQGAGRLDLLESYEILLKYRPRASILPSVLDFTDCPYTWPFCRQPLYAGAMPVIFNATILNGMGVTGRVESEPAWHPFDEVGNLLNIYFTYSDVIWPWTGYLALHMQIKDEGAQFSGLIEGNVTFTVVSPPAKGENTPRRSVCTLSLKLQVITTPPRSQRILWDQFHSVRYPPGYIPRDSLDVKNDILDWHGDHPHTNFHGMFDMLRDAGYYMEILGSPLTCFDASQYGTLLMVDLEDEFFQEEIDKLEKDVKVHDLGLVVFGDWYNVETMVKMKFFDDNTRSWWTPATGGANIPALNDLLKPFGIAFGDTLLNGAFFLAGERSHYASGTDIAEFPEGGFIHNFSFQDKSVGGTTQNVIQASGLAKVESSVLGVLEMGGGTGRIAVYGDSNCLDSSHMVINCYWLLRKLLGFTSQNIQDPMIFSASNRLASPLIRNEASFPGRREDVNITSYSSVINHDLMCMNDARFEVWGTKGYDEQTWRNRKLPGIPSPFIIRQPMTSKPDISQGIVSARPATGNTKLNLTAKEETYHFEINPFNATKDVFGLGQIQGLEQGGNQSFEIPLSKRNISRSISSRKHHTKMDVLGWLNGDE
ncbi:hypothetical protein KI387_012235, partial [Taxus chinensis]